jgi:hypothetical protein
VAERLTDGRAGAGACRRGWGLACLPAAVGVEAIALPDRPVGIEADGGVALGRGLPKHLGLLNPESMGTRASPLLTVKMLDRMND